MSLISPRYFITEKMAGLAHWISRGRWHVISSQTVDSLHAEIYQFEKTLANAPTRTLRNSRPLEPITEQQKIMDLAG